VHKLVSIPIVLQIATAEWHLCLCAALPISYPVQSYGSCGPNKDKMVTTLTNILALLDIASPIRLVKASQSTMTATSHLLYHTSTSATR